MPQVTVQANDEQDARWIQSRPAVIKLICDCLWDEATGDIRIRPDCEGHSLFFGELEMSRRGMGA